MTQRQGNVLPFFNSGGERGGAEIGVFVEQPFSVVKELSLNRMDYSGGETFSISGMPNYIMMATERLRHRVALPLIGTSPTLCCCIKEGLRILMEEGDLIDLLDLRREFNLLGDSDNELIDNIHLLFRSIPLGIPDAAMLGYDKVSIRIPEDLKVRLFNRANGLGIAASKFAIVAIMEVLRFESSVQKRHRTFMTNSIMSFMKRLKFHRIIVEGAIETLTESKDFSVSALKRVAKKLMIELGNLTELSPEEEVAVKNLIIACKVFGAS